MFSFKDSKGEGKYFRGTEKDLDNYLRINRLNLFDAAIDPSCDCNLAFFRDIESLSTPGEASHLLNPRYFVEQIDAESIIMFDYNTNNSSKTKARELWTNKSSSSLLLELGVEAGDALSESATPVSAGLLHNKSSTTTKNMYQVFARHRLERTLRERDGVFLSVSHKAAFLVTVKARYGAVEERDLLADIGGGLLRDNKFVLSDWYFQTSEEEAEKTLLQMMATNHYPELEGVKELELYGIAVSPFIDPKLPEEHPRIIRVRWRDISHNFPATAGGALGSLIAAKIAAERWGPSFFFFW